MKIVNKNFKPANNKYSKLAVSIEKETKKILKNDSVQDAQIYDLRRIFYVNQEIEEKAKKLLLYRALKSNNMYEESFSALLRNLLKEEWYRIK